MLSLVLQLTTLSHESPASDSLWGQVSYHLMALSNTNIELQGPSLYPPVSLN